MPDQEHAEWDSPTLYSGAELASELLASNGVIGADGIEAVDGHNRADVETQVPERTDAEIAVQFKQEITDAVMTLEQGVLEAIKRLPQEDHYYNSLNSVVQRVQALIHEMPDRAEKRMIKTEFGFLERANNTVFAAYDRNTEAMRTHADIASQAEYMVAGRVSDKIPPRVTGEAPHNEGLIAAAHRGEQVDYDPQEEYGRTDTASVRDALLEPATRFLTNVSETFDEDANLRRYANRILVDLHTSVEGQLQTLRRLEEDDTLMMEIESALRSAYDTLATQAAEADDSGRIRSETLAVTFDRAVERIDSSIESVRPDEKTPQPKAKGLKDIIG